MKKTKIHENVIPEAFLVSVQVFNGDISTVEGVNTLVDNFNINANSARDYIYNYKSLRQGKRFTRTLNAASMEYFFMQLQNEHGIENISNPLQSLLKHINYYEDLQNIKMHKMRAIHKKYSKHINQPELASTIEHIIQNIETLENFLAGNNLEERLESMSLIKRGTCFVVYKREGQIRFAPSRFLGYINNFPFKYSSDLVDGRDTNNSISSILRCKPLPDSFYENSYINYCESLGIKSQPTGGAYGVKRKFWNIDIPITNPKRKELSEFPEGSLVESLHKRRERNPRVIQIAKELFKKKHGSLYCQVCGFNFEKAYGDVGIDFIEGHHTIAVKDMPPNHKTSPDDIALLCSNCHRMVHRKRPWLNMKELSLLINV